MELLTGVQKNRSWCRHFLSRSVTLTFSFFSAEVRGNDGGSRYPWDCIRKHLLSDFNLLIYFFFYISFVSAQSAFYTFYFLDNVGNMLAARL